MSQFGLPWYHSSRMRRDKTLNSYVVCSKSYQEALLIDIMIIMARRIQYSTELSYIKTALNLITLTFLKMRRVLHRRWYRHSFTSVVVTTTIIEGHRPQRAIGYIQYYIIATPRSIHTPVPTTNICQPTTTRATFISLLPHTYIYQLRTLSAPSTPSLHEGIIPIVKGVLLAGSSPLTCRQAQIKQQQHFMIR